MNMKAWSLANLRGRDVLDGQKQRRRDVIYSRSFTMSDAELGNSTCIINLPVRISITEIPFLSLTNTETLILHSHKLGINQEQCHASPQCYFMSKRRVEECLMPRFTRDFSRSQMPKCFCELRLKCLRSLTKQRGKKRSCN